MKKWFTGFSMCWGMFCAIPNPIRRWDSGCYRQMLLCLPFLGGALGLIWTGIGLLLLRISAPGPIFALCMTVAPWCLTGFIHLDGFMDCCDAVLSRREQARRREILKDSHVGSFAVICLVLLATAGYSVWLCPGEADRLWALPLVCAGARCVSAGAVLGLKPLETSGYHAMGQSRGAAATAWALGAVSVGLGVLGSGWGFLPPAMAIFVAAVTAFSLRRNLGGMCGDISGAAITLGEMAGSAALLLL